MKNKLTIAFSLLLLFSSITFAEDRKGPFDNYTPFTLESDLLNHLDGISGMIDGNVLGFMIHLRNEVNKIRLGVKQKSGGYIGMFNYEGKKQAIVDLLLVELELDLEPNEKRLQELHKVLELVKKKIADLLVPFLDDARAVKKPMIHLINEWSHKAHRPDSDLCEWMNTPEGAETSEFFQKGTSFKRLDRFIADLAHFMETMCRSCPKAAKQFKELIKQKEHK